MLGHFGVWDYAVSVTDGLSDVRFTDSGANPLVTARVAYVKDDWQAGFSTLLGRVLLDPEFESGRGFVSERRFAVDGTKPFGPLMLRAEGIGGTDDGRAVGGGIVLADYALTPDLELNTRYAAWSKGGDRQSLGVGLTYQLRTGLYVRLADIYTFTREENNALTLQIYYEFSRLL